MFVAIEKYPFDVMGSLVSSAADIVVVSGLTNQSIFRVGKGPLGPFSSSIEGSQATLDSYLAMIASGELDPCYPVDVYLVYRFCHQGQKVCQQKVPGDRS